MAERYHNYYRINWHASGMHGPVTTKKQLLNEIELSLMQLSEDNSVDISIIQFQMTEEQFRNRPNELKNYGYEGTMQ